MFVCLFVCCVRVCAWVFRFVVCIGLRMSAVVALVALSIFRTIQDAIHLFCTMYSVVDVVAIVAAIIVGCC